MDKNTERNLLANRLKEAREYSGFSQDEVAKYLQIPRSAISLIESGERRLEAIELTKLADLYQRDMNYFTNLAEPKTNDSIQMVARAVADLSEKDREEILRFADFLRTRQKG